MNTFIAVSRRFSSMGSLCCAEPLVCEDILLSLVYSVNKSLLNCLIIEVHTKSIYASL